MIVILGTAHRLREPGKQSPDGRLKEYLYSREIVAELKARLERHGITTFVDLPDTDLPRTMQTPSYTLERQRELALRVNFVNDLCKEHGKQNCLYVSIHLNAAGADGQWHNAGGWSAYTSVGNTRADLIAECLYDAAEEKLQPYAEIMEEGKANGIYGKNQRPIRTDTTDGDRDLESNLYVLKNTYCPAVLTENLFQDNQADVAFLLSDIGRHIITEIHLEGILKYITAH